MKTSRKTVLVISVVILILLSTFIPIYIVYKHKDPYIKHEPIIVWQDEDFQNFDFKGDGSQENPYLIENLEIITDFKYSIYIKNTIKYFIIRNCYLEASEYGIYIDNIADGTAIITDNICDNNEIGIRISNSNDIFIANNSCSNNLGTFGGGIIISDSSFCNVSNNICTENELYGIRLDGSRSCYLLNNTCTYNEGEFQGAGIYVFQSTATRLESNVCNSNRRFGIHISVSDSTILSDNICEDNYHTGIFMVASHYSTIVNNRCFRNQNWFERDSHGLVLQYSSFCRVTNNLIDSNIGNGIFLEGDSNCIISDNLIYNQTEYDELLYSEYSTYFGFAVYCLSSNNISIISNDCINNFGGCWVENSQDVNISSNQFVESTNSAVEIYATLDCSLERNILESNMKGIIINDTVSSIVKYNLIQNTNSYGLSFYSLSSNNTVHHNSFLDNNLAGTSQGYDDGSNNYWYDNVTKEGNFWSDRISGNYSIDGLANSEDIYCLNENPLIILFSVNFISDNQHLTMFVFTSLSSIQERYYVMHVLFLFLFGYLTKSKK